MPGKLTATVGRRDLIAVFDESGGETNVPGQALGADFALAAIIFDGRRAWRDLVDLDGKLQAITGKADYKYRQVRQSTEARRAVVGALHRQSGLIRLFAFYAAGGAFVEQARRELHAVKSMKNDETAIREAHANLDKMLAEPRREGLIDAIRTSVPAMSTWAGARNRRIRVYFDQRTDLNDIADDLLNMMRVWSYVGILGDGYQWMDWGGACPPELEGVSRLADTFAGDIRATFRKHGQSVWDVVEQDGFVGRHREVALSDDAEWAGPVPTPRVGRVEGSVWDDDWETGSTTTTMFRGYLDHFIKRRVSVYSPCGRGGFLVKAGDGFDLYQVMD